MSLSTLSPLEARVLGVLVEKQATVPDSYPLSLNALLSGCNQKTAREPVLNLTEAEVLLALDGLKSQSLVFEVSGSRVVRYEHNAARGLRVPVPAAALLATLMLRGAQTAAELRANCERLHRFADIAAIETCLDELAELYPPRVVKLARAPGARESRWAHLLCGEAALPGPVASADDSASSSGGYSAAGGSGSGATSLDLAELASLRAEQRRLVGEVERLQGQVAKLAAALGVDLDAAEL
ncbi:MAG: hypothetical protein RJA44_339 [Pseudomonadota bacterium]